MSDIPTLFPITITGIKNNFLLHVILRCATRDVTNIIERFPFLTRHDLYLYLREIQFHNKTAEMTIFENAYEEFIMYIN